jgi:hypothetical protein
MWRTAHERRRNNGERGKGPRPALLPKSPRLKTVARWWDHASANFATPSGEPVTIDGGVKGFADPSHAGSHQPNTLSEERQLQASK